MTGASARPQEARRLPPTTVAGRRVVHAVGTKTQTVSMCTASSQEGVDADRDLLPVTVDVVGAALHA